MHLDPGQTISAPFLACRAQVKRFSPRAGYCILEVVLDDGNATYQTLRVSEQQLREIKVEGSSSISRIENAEELFLYVEANRLRLAYQFDPQLAVSVSQVDPLPHQIEAVYHYVLRYPRVRFLIADDPGAGKTVMAGLILKELMYRHVVRRVLIVAPGHLKYQWQREMKEKFGLSFAIVDRGMMNAAWAENVWEERDDCITSIDFIKQEQIRESLRNVRWDLVIVDEAHKMSAYAYQGRDRTRIDKTQRYRAGELLSANSEHMLFLTATPHRGDEESFRLFLDLLRPGFFAQPELLQQSVADQDNPVFIRRLKEDMRTFDGKAIFPPRHVRTVNFRLTEPERELYNRVTDYVRNYFDMAKENRSISFALMILQRRLTSSSYAIYRSLVRRRERMEELLALPEKIREDREDYLAARKITTEELEDLSEDEREQIERRIEHLTIAQNIDDVKAEIAQLDVLIAQAQTVLQQETESKLVGLRDDVLRSLGDRKLLIFTEFKDTLDYLAGDGKQGRPLGKLREWGYDIITIDGSMGMDARIAAEHAFRDRAQILVATEAAGEGINLQFCSLMVNYDIPWNPNRLEQRMGRIHRYGQNREVFIWNLITQDTREGQILERIFEKLNTMREALGSDRVFDIIGEMLPGTRLDELLRDAIFSQRRMEDIEQHIEAVDVDSVRHTLDEVFLTGLATRHIDYATLRQESLEAEENRLVPEYVGDYFRRAFQRFGGIAEPRGELYAVRSVPFDLRRWGSDYRFKTTYGQLFREYRRITFDKKLARVHPEAEFVAPGHPLLEALNEEIICTLNHANGSYAVFSDPQGDFDGVLWFLEGTVQDGRGQAAGRRVFCLYESTQGDIAQVNPAVLWDLDAQQEGEVSDIYLTQLAERERIEDYAITDLLFPYLHEIQERREHEAAIKTKYGLRSLDYLIQESNQKILDYQLRQATGQEMDLPLLNEQRNLDGLNIRRVELEQEIRLESSLTVGEPRILGAAVVVPIRAVQDQNAGGSMHAGVCEDEAQYGDGAPMHRDDAIEAVGMRVAMAYERDAGWVPEDVASANVGFDVRSLRYAADGSLADVRYIEVKARARTGAIRLTNNEWKHARKFGEHFWLYIVTDAGTDAPRLHHIQNPAAKFVMGEDVVATGYEIGLDVWTSRAE